MIEPTANLEKQLKESRERQEKSRVEWEKGLQKNNDNFNAAEEESEKKLIQLREANQKQLQALETELHNTRIHHENRIALKQKMHDDYMAQIRDSSRVERMAAANIHEREIELIRRDHEHDVTSSKMQIEAIKMNGEKEVHEVERQLKKLHKKRDKELDKHNKEMMKMLKKTHKVCDEEKKSQHGLKMEEMKLESERKTTEHKVVLKQIVEAREMSHRVSVNAASKEAYSKFLQIMDTMNETRNSLNDIKLLCDKETNEYDDSDASCVDYFGSAIEETRSVFEIRTKAFQAFLLNQSNVDQELVGAYQHVLCAMKDVMESGTIRSICSALPRLIEQQNHERVRETVGKIDGLMGSLGEISTKVRNIEGWKQLEIMDSGASGNKK